MDEQLRVGIYLRVSSDEQREAGTIENQRHFAAGWVAFRGYEIYDWYEDDGVSGDIPFRERPAGGRLLADARAGHFDLVCVYDTSRLSRRALDVLMIEGELRDMGIALHAMTQGVDTSTEEGQMQSGLFAVFAQYEKAQLLKRTKAGQLRVARQGRWLGRLPLGYTTDTNGCLAIDEATAPLARRIWSMCADEGMSSNAIAAQLNEEGVPAIREGHWWHPVISRMLRSRVYIGEATYNKSKGRRRNGKALARERRPSDEHITIPAPRLIDDDTWYRAQEVLEGHKRAGWKNAKRVYVLRGLIICPHCGLTWRASAARSSNGRTYYYYVHKPQRELKGKAKCPPPTTIPLPFAEGMVWARIARAAHAPGEWAAEVRAATERTAPTAPDPQQELARLEQERDRERKILVRLARLSLTDEEFDKVAAETHERLRALERRAGQIAERARAAATLDQRITAGRNVLQEVQAILEDATPEQKQSLAHRLIRRIYIREEGGKYLFDIEWR